MLILALDTTSRGGSVAVLDDETVLHEIVGDDTLTHAQRLPLAFEDAAAGAGVRLPDIELLAVASGPGSFTGLRVGIAAIQGLAFALDRKVVPVPTLEAIAAVGAPGRRVAAWMDAQRHEVFAALPGEIDPVAGRPEEVLAAWAERTNLDGVAFEGDGAVRYADRIRAALGDRVTIADSAAPLAAAIGRLARASAGRAVVPHAIVPAYVRRPDAELARERRAGSA